jgi:hypothetical protein
MCLIPMVLLVVKSGNFYVDKLNWRRLFGFIHGFAPIINRK